MEEQHGEHPFNHAGQLLCLGLFFVLWGSDSFFTHTSTFLSEYVPLLVRIVITVLLFAVAIYVFRAVISAFPDETDAEQIISSGPYRFARHPMYMACMIFYIGLSLSTMSLFSSILVLGIFIFYDHVAAYEERILIERYGQQYTDYMLRTGRWFPRMLKRRLER